MSIYTKMIQNLPKNGKSYGHFPLKRLHDSGEDHILQMGILGCSSVPERSKIRQEMAELWLFSTERLRDFIENHMGLKGILGCSFVPKRSKIRQEMAELWLFSH